MKPDPGITAFTLASAVVHLCVWEAYDVFGVWVFSFACFLLHAWWTAEDCQTKNMGATDITNWITFIIKTHTLDDSVTAHVYPLRLQSGNSRDFVFKNSPMIKCHFISTQTQRWNVLRVNFGRVCCEQKGEATLTVGSIYGNSVTHAGGEALQSLSHWLCWDHPWVPFFTTGFQFVNIKNAWYLLIQIRGNLCLWRMLRRVWKGVLGNMSERVHS